MEDFSIKFKLHDEVYVLHRGEPVKTKITRVEVCWDENGLVTTYRLDRPGGVHTFYDWEYNDYPENVIAYDKQSLKEVLIKKELSEYEERLKNISKTFK